MLISTDALDAVRALLSSLPLDGALTPAEEATLSTALTRCVLTARLLVGYATRLAGKPGLNSAVPAPTELSVSRWSASQCRGCGTRSPPRIFVQSPIASPVVSPI